MGLVMPRVLPVTIGVLMVSIAIRSVSLVSAAVPSGPPAAGGPPPPAVPASAAAGKAVSAPATPAMAPAAIPSGDVPKPVSEAEAAILVDLRARSAEIDGRAQALALREQIQAAAERRLSARLDELTALQKRLEEMESARRARQEQDWRGMVKVYETMKPRDAAAIFNELDKPVLLQILDRMQERRASLVLAAMLPERARQATTDLAAMREKAASVPPSADAVRQ